MSRGRAPRYPGRARAAFPVARRSFRGGRFGHLGIGIGVDDTRNGVWVSGCEPHDRCQCTFVACRRVPRAQLCFRLIRNRRSVDSICPPGPLRSPPRPNQKSTPGRGASHASSPSSILRAPPRRAPPPSAANPGQGAGCSAVLRAPCPLWFIRFMHPFRRRGRRTAPPMVPLRQSERKSDPILESEYIVLDFRRAPRFLSARQCWTLDDPQS